MKIVVNAVYAKMGGAATYVQNLLSELSSFQSRHQFVILVPPNFAPAKTRSKQVQIRVTDVGNHASWKRFLWDQFTLREMIQHEKADALLSSANFGVLFPPCKQVLMVRNALYFSQEYLNSFYPFLGRGEKLDFLLRRKLIKLSAQHSDIIMTPSLSMKTDAEKFIHQTRGKWLVNHFGVPLQQFSGFSSHSSEPFRMLYVSEYADHKNLLVLLQALKILKERNGTGFHLTTTINPRRFPNLKFKNRNQEIQLAFDPELQSWIEIKDRVTYDAIPSLYAQSNLFIFPSLVESFGHPLVEAMASSLPVLASDIPICHELCEDAAWYFNPFDPEALASKIAELREKSELRNTLGNLGRKRAEALFDWKDHIQRLIEAFEMLS